MDGWMAGLTEGGTQTNGQLEYGIMLGGGKHTTEIPLPSAQGRRGEAGLPRRPAYLVVNEELPQVVNG